MTEGPLWRFAVELYAQPGVAHACMYLQDHHGVDVCLLLACAWYGHHRRRALSRDDAAALARDVTPAREVVLRARALRRARATADDREAYAAAQREELAAESEQLAQLSDRLAHGQLGTAATADPVGACLTACVDDAAARDRLAPIVAAVARFGTPA